MTSAEILGLIDKGGTVAILIVALLALAWMVRWLFTLLLARQDQSIAYREALVERRDLQLTQMRELLNSQQSLFDRSLDMQQTLLDRLEAGRRRTP